MGICVDMLENLAHVFVPLCTCKSVGALARRWQGRAAEIPLGKTSTSPSLKRTLSDHSG